MKKVLKCSFVIDYDMINTVIKMRMISWNVNGIRACLTKGFIDFFNEIDADIFCIQESKAQPEQIELEFNNYYKYVNSADKKGYSGTVVFSKEEALSVSYDLGIDQHDHEGRMITLEFSSFYFVCVYTPNAQDGLKRIDYRLCWEEDFKLYLTQLKKKKSVIVCGDLNVAHQEIDLKNPKQNRGNAGFSDEERNAFSSLLAEGFIDTFRYFYPDKIDAYSWWSYRFNARARNAGWRIDYFLVSQDLKEQIKDSIIYNEIYGSDHCPIGLEIEVNE